MANVEFEVDDLNEFDNDDIVDHLIHEISTGYVHKSDMDKLRSALGTPTQTQKLKVITQSDRMKFDLIAKLFDRIPIDLLNAIDQNDEDKLQEFCDDFASGVYL